MTCDVTFEELAGFLSGDTATERKLEIREHLRDCDQCHRRLKALERADTALAVLPASAPPAAVILATRRALAEALRGPSFPEILILEEVAAFLRLRPEQLTEIIDELPTFELAGQIRIRRVKLIEWIEHREKDHRRQMAASWAARAGSGEFRMGA